MSRLKNRLSRRTERKAETSENADSAVMRGPQAVSNGAEQAAPCENNRSSKADEITGSKSEIIAQLQRRMEKIERKKVKAFGTKNTHEADTVLRPSGRHEWPSGSSGTRLAEHDSVDSAEQDTEDDVEAQIQKESLLPGELRDTSAGEIWCNRERYLGYFHGNTDVNLYLSAGGALATFAKDQRLAELPPEGALFIDTETTGLSSGAGTLPFLIGCGFFEEGVFVVEQYFCREPSEEPAQLEALSQRLAKARYLVSFNGKSFDMPLINTRFIINKMKNPGYNLPHLDLLHVCRRIFKRRLNDRSLQNLERVILGFTREGDIPGALIPEAYRDYLFGHGEDQIAAILEHNLLDIVALAALGGVLDQIYNDPEAVADVADHLGLAKEAFGVGETDIGNMHLDAVEDGGPGDDRLVALHMKAKAALRGKAYSDAAVLYLKIIEEDSADLDAHLQLSKIYEHRIKDFDKALHHAKAASELEGADAGEHRIRRIEKKRDKRLGRRKW